jgi:dephospho-CoA kinase
MNRTCVIGLTGGMGAGKSTVVQHMKFEHIYDCDAAVHRLYKNPIMRAWLAEKFGPFEGDARAYFTQMVLNDPLVIDTLQDMFIPAIKMEIQDRLHDASEPITRLFIDAPLLYETGMNRICDYVVVVHCPEKIRRERIIQREGMTEQKMNLLLARQFKDEDRLALADFVIHNTGILEDTYKQVDAMLEWLTQEIANG